MTIKNVAGMLLALVLGLCSVSAMAVHNYGPTIADINGGNNIFAKMISRKNGITNIQKTEEAKNGLIGYWELGTPMQMLSGEPLEVLADNNGVYQAKKEMMAEVYAIIWRYGNNKYQKSSYGATASSNKKETTPFYDSGSQFYGKDLVISVQSRGIETEIRLWAGNKYPSSDIRYPIHKVGTMFGNARGLSNNLAITAIVNYYEVTETGRRGKPLVDAKDILTMMVTWLTIGQIIDLPSEKSAYEAGYNGGLMVVYVP